MLKHNLRQWDRTLVWHPFTQMAEYEPLMLERGQGCLLFDIDGNQYIDGVSSLWCNIHGHRHPRLGRGHPRAVGPRGPRHRPGRVEPARPSSSPGGWSSLAPPGLGHVFFSDDGATAVEVAIKMAFQYWRQRPRPAAGKDLLPGPGRRLSRRHAGERERGRGGAVPRHVPAAAVRDAPPALARHLSHARRACRPSNLAGTITWRNWSECSAEHHRRIAAMVIEPLVQAAAGMIMHPAGYLRGVRELTRQVRRAADRRRSGRRHGPHRADVRLRARAGRRQICSAWPRA